MTLERPELIPNGPVTARLSLYLTSTSSIRRSFKGKHIHTKLDVNIIYYRWTLGIMLIEYARDYVHVLVRRKQCKNFFLKKNE